MIDKDRPFIVKPPSTSLASQIRDRIARQQATAVPPAEPPAGVPGPVLPELGEPPEEVPGVLLVAPVVTPAERPAVEVPEEPRARPRERLVLRCTPEYHAWVAGLADFLGGLGISTVVDRGLHRLADAVQYKSLPPRRWSPKHRDPDA